MSNKLMMTNVLNVLRVTTEKYSHIFCPSAVSTGGPDVEYD